MTVRLQKLLSERGVASRRTAEKMIADGRVSVNGHTASLGQSVDPQTDTVCVDALPLPPAQRRVYIMLNKPRGYVTTLSDERGRKTAAQLVADCGARVFPVGRLDMDSEGLLLFTNDGEFANALMHPRHEVEKTYRVWVTGFDEASLSRLRRPIELDGVRIREPKVELLSRSADSACVRVTIHEGKNRQVRRMCAAAGLGVRRLRRVAEGKVSLGSLEVGKWRHLTEEEVNLLCNL